MSVSSNLARRRLRSATRSDYMIPRTSTKFGDRAKFSVAGPKVWNSLPESIRAANTSDSFRQKLKAHLLNIAFNLLNCPGFYEVISSRSVSLVGRALECKFVFIFTVKKCTD